MSPAPEESSADLGHRLRTPLTHIIGYSALLLESDFADSTTAARLTGVNQQAEIIVERIAHWLAGGTTASGRLSDRIAGLRAEMAQPLTGIIRNVGALAQSAEGSALLDVLRISRACTELLLFVQQEGAASRISPAGRAALPREDTAKPTPVPGARILAVDDNPANLDMLARQLARYGHTTACFQNGVAGLQALEKELFDLVLLDLMMPGLSGVEVLQRIKALPALAGIPVIMISALDEVSSAAKCIEMGAEDYLLKPFDPVLLRARLHSALERRRHEEERRERTEQLEKATQDLQRANDDLQSFASVASHDLQEPLRTITTTLQLFAIECADSLSEEHRELFRHAVDGSARMSSLISDLLTYSLSGTPEVVLGTVDCEAALLEAISNLREAIKESGAQINHGDLPPIPGQAGGMVQLFQNLVANAIKYRSARRPEIRITAEQEGAEWVFAVEDNGIGIEEQFLRKIFQPFGRLHGQERPGTGLGLSICERIVRKSGGRIWVDSTPGEGSTFYFTAPRLTEGDVLFEKGAAL